MFAGGVRARHANPLPDQAYRVPLAPETTSGGAKPSGPAAAIPRRIGEIVSVRVAWKIVAVPVLVTTIR